MASAARWESQRGIPSALYISCGPITCQARAARGPITCAHDMDRQPNCPIIGPIPWGHVVIVVVVIVVDVMDIARRLRYSYSWRATSDTW